jgi:hypothetical protein
MHKPAYRKQVIGTCSSFFWASENLAYFMCCVVKFL